MIKTNWNSIKAIKESNSNVIFYAQEAEYRSNSTSIEDRDRYRIMIQDGIMEYEACITIENPGNSEQIDFEDNYKALAIII